MNHLKLSATFDGCQLLFLGITYCYALTSKWLIDHFKDLFYQKCKRLVPISITSSENFILECEKIKILCSVLFPVIVPLQLWLFSHLFSLFLLIFSPFYKLVARGSFGGILISVWIFYIFTSYRFIVTMFKQLSG